MKKHLVKTLFLAIVSFISYDVSAQTIVRTIAGNGAQAYSGEGAEAILAGLGNVYSVAVDDSGYVYSCDNYFNNVRKITPRGMISTYAGNGSPGYGGDYGPSTAAIISSPFSLALDSLDNVYIADAANYVIRKIDRTDTITTVAGNHTTGYFNGDGISALAAKIGAAGIAFDTHGNMFIADGNTRVRKVNTAGIISTVAGNGTVGFAGDGGAATSATLDGAVGVCVDNAGNIYFADKNNHVVRKVSATTGLISRFAGSSSAASGFSGDGGQATACKLSGPNAVRVDPQGNIVIVDQNNNRIRRVNVSTGIISTIVGASSSGGFSGDGGPATAAVFAFPADVCWDRFGNMFIADKGQASSNNGHRIREVFKVDTLHLTANPGDTVCGYSHVTYTAHEMAGKHYLSFFKWRLNGVVVGANSPSYYSDSVHNGDVITCSMIDTANGGFIIAVSDTIRMVVRPVVVPSVALTSTGDTLCAGQPVSITAHPTNGGTNPKYHWYRFGTLIDTGLTFTYTPSVGDIITCVLVSNAVCATPDSISASKAMVVNISYPPLITLLASHDTTIRYWGEWVTLFSELTYQGTHPTFQWYKNGLPIAGATDDYYTDEVYTNDTLYCVMYSNAPCVVPDHDTSNVVVISVGHLGVNNVGHSGGNFKIQPNPNTGTFTLVGEVPASNGKPLEYTITDMLGKIIYQGKAPVNNGKVGALVQPGKPIPDGMYLLTIQDGNGNQVFHFVVKN